MPTRCFFVLNGEILLQSRRQFWPTLTTRHASLVPVSAEALQRERRQMQAKHLWYNVDTRWSDLKDKLEVLAPPLDSPERIFGGISSSQSSARTPMRRAATQMGPMYRATVSVTQFACHPEQSFTFSLLFVRSQHD